MTGGNPFLAGELHMFQQGLRRFLKKNIPRGGPWQCGQDHCLPPAGGGSQRWRMETPGETFSEIA